MTTDKGIRPWPSPRVHSTTNSLRKRRINEESTVRTPRTPSRGINVCLGVLAILLHPLNGGHVLKSTTTRSTYPTPLVSSPEVSAFCAFISSLSPFLESTICNIPKKSVISLVELLRTLLEFLFASFGWHICSSQHFVTIILRNRRSKTYRSCSSEFEDLWIGSLARMHSRACARFHDARGR